MIKKLNGRNANSVLKQRKDIVLIDVRTREEYEEYHIEGSINIPYDVIETKMPMIIRDKKRKIFVYCNSGFRSSAAARILDRIGYTNVYNIGKISDIK